VRAEVERDRLALLDQILRYAMGESVRQHAASRTWVDVVRLKPSRARGDAPSMPK
jgi:hypothetical protein